MSSALPKPLALADFLAGKRAQELRFEFDGFQPVAMTGRHDCPSVIAQPTSSAPCRTGCAVRHAGRSGAISLKYPRLAGRVRYPVAFVTCSPVAK